MSVKLMNQINARIDTLAQSERVTKKELGLVSRELLEYIVIEDTNDIGMVNRLLNVLTPMNLKTACLFFDEFLPFKFDDKTVSFTSKVKGEKKLDKYLQKVKDFLATDDNIWDWAARNVKIEKKKVDWFGKITSDIKKSMSEEDEETRLTPAQVLQAVMNSGISAQDVVEILAVLEEPKAIAA